MDDLFNHNLRKGSISQIFENFYEKFTHEIYRKIDNPKESVYTITNANFLSSANTLTRTLSTELGKVWEDIGSLSNCVISPDDVFGGFKLKGVDLIILEDGHLKFI